MTPEPPAEERFWIPDDPDGSGWADVDWVSASRGSRYHYCHTGPIEEERQRLPAFYKVVTRLESPQLHAHQNSYFVTRDRLADFLAEISLAGGAEVIWHVEPCPSPPPQSGVLGARK